MGYFSWLTADTNESIPNVASGREIRTVYLLQPTGKPPIAEPAYEGFGNFGRVDAYEWLARSNLPQAIAEEIAPDALRHVGIVMAFGQIYEDHEAKKKYLNALSAAQFGVFDAVKRFVRHIEPDVEVLKIRYDDILPGYDASLNELLGSKRLIPTPLEIAQPLKFSFDPSARYEDLPASKTCPDQGIYYGDTPSGPGM